MVAPVIEGRSGGEAEMREDLGNHGVYDDDGVRAALSCQPIRPAVRAILDADYARHRVEMPDRGSGYDLWVRRASPERDGLARRVQQ